ncbi:carboxypeptidase regulatory-like domain-containing protein [Maribacter flavus]|uniref:Carboxypeptidase regulatory-like domain-containing protein n=1 Tax=Maribacter flavus TaxID=1658664 RepID=A0A5B2TX09_9FLAO|nr:carboxypeptidase regulatory-like domain-containing protein [Maribacter flavus]
MFLLLISCGSKPNDFYQGLVMDKNGNLIENVSIFEEYDTENRLKTNKKGYFKLNRTSDRIQSLVFVKEGFKTDTIPTVWAQHGEKLNYQFIKNDTTVVRLKTVKSK